MRIVEQRQHKDRSPYLRAAGIQPAPPQEQPHRRGSQGQPQPDIGERRNLMHGDADEQEGRTPD
jgi:hypothetical protein